MKNSSHDYVTRVTNFPPDRRKRSRGKKTDYKETLFKSGYITEYTNNMESNEIAKELLGYAVNDATNRFLIEASRAEDAELEFNLLLSERRRGIDTSILEIMKNACLTLTTKRCFREAESTMILLAVQASQLGANWKGAIRSLGEPYNTDYMRRIQEEINKTTIQ